MPRDRNVRRAIALQNDPALPPTLELRTNLCEIIRPDSKMKERLERHLPPLPTCNGTNCAVRTFFQKAAEEGIPVELDVGCGYGRFSRAHALANPRIRLLGIEQDDARVARSDVLARKSGIANLAYLIGEARYALEYCIPENSISAIFILFPDPWPKDRHARNRIFRKPVVDLLFRLLIPGGFLHAATDNEPYFRQMQSVMADDLRFQSVPAYRRSKDEQTDFEQKFLSQGKLVHAASWQKQTS